MLLVVLLDHRNFMQMAKDDQLHTLETISQQQVGGP